jgi:hypothetical protein
LDLIEQIKQVDYTKHSGFLLIKFNRSFSMFLTRTSSFNEVFANKRRNWIVSLVIISVWFVDKRTSDLVKYDNNSGSKK